MEFFSLDILLRLMFPLFILRKFVRYCVFKAKKKIFQNTHKLDAYLAIVSEKMDKYTETPGDKTCPSGQWSLQRQNGRPALGSILHLGQSRVKFMIIDQLSNKNNNHKMLIFNLKYLSHKANPKRNQNKRF